MVDCFHCPVRISFQLILIYGLSMQAVLRGGERRKVAHSS